MDELSEDDRKLVYRAKKIQKFFTQPLFTAEQFSGIKGTYVKLSKTVSDFKAIIDGKCDNLPEDAFYMVGTLEDVYEKAKKL